MAEFADFTELVDFAKFAELAELMEKFSAPQPTPIYKLNMMSVVWNISIGQLGLAAWLCSLPAPAHLLCSRTRESERSP